MATVRDVTLPDIGDFSGVEIIEILVAPGDRIEAEQSLLTLESDKATIEIPAPFAGVVKEIKVAVGDKISQGDLLFTVESEEQGDEAAPSGRGAAEPEQPEQPEPPPGVGPKPTAPAPAPAAPPSAPQAPKGAQTPSESPAGPVEVRLPDVGDFSDIPVIEILIAPGDRIEAEQSMLTLESDKATMEIPAPQAGLVRDVAVKVGDKLSRGDLIMTLLPEGPTAPAEQAPAAEPPARQAPAPAPPEPGETAAQAESRARLYGEKERRQAPVLPRPQDMAAIARGRKPHASPAVRRFARELGVDLARVRGSGPKGRIRKDDVQSFVKQALSAGGPGAAAGLPFALPAAPEVDFSRFGPIEQVELSRIKKRSGTHLHRCWLTVPHVTQFDEADITELEAFRGTQKEAAAAQGVKLTFLPFLVKAVAAALNGMPNLKASLAPDGEHLILKQYTHVGVAVDTKDGLVVPVVRDADRKGVLDIARELAKLSEKARAGKLLPGDMQGGCFSISSLGGIGGTAFTPIVNNPEVAILGVSRSAMKPVWDGREFVPRLMLPLALSYDHRVVDGAEGVRFTSLLGELLGDIRRLLL